jgi:hypothetical protein
MLFGMKRLYLTAEEKNLLSYVIKLVTIETKGIELKRFHYALKAGLFLKLAKLDARKKASIINMAITEHRFL